jgi:hypothetical protein
MWTFLKCLTGTNNSKNIKINEIQFNDCNNDTLCNKFNNFYVNGVHEIIYSIDPCSLNMNPYNTNEPLYK